MIDEIIENRREVLDLLLLVGVLSFITSLSSSLVADTNIVMEILGFSLPIQALLILFLLIIFLAYLGRSSLFSLVEERWINIPLGYDRDEESLLVPIGVAPGTVFLSSMNRAWQNHRASESGNSGQGDPIKGEGTEVTLTNLLEYGVFQIFSQAFQSGWDIETTRMDRSTIRRPNEQPYCEWDTEAIASAFPNNPLLEEEKLSDRDEIQFQVPPGTIITNENESNSDEWLNILLKNDYVKVQLQIGSSSSGRGYLPLKVGRPGKEIELYRNASDTEKLFEFQKRFSYASVNVLATIKPSRRRLLHPDANRHLRWAENLVNEIENASEYPVEQVGPVNVV